MKTVKKLPVHFAVGDYYYHPFCDGTLRRCTVTHVEHGMADHKEFSKYDECVIGKWPFTKYTTKCVAVGRTFDGTEPAPLTEVPRFAKPGFQFEVHETLFEWDRFAKPRTVYGKANDVSQLTEEDWIILRLMRQCALKGMTMGDDYAKTALWLCDRMTLDVVGEAAKLIDAPVPSAYKKCLCCGGDENDPKGWYCKSCGAC